MDALGIAVIVVFGFLLGVFIIKYLSVHPTQMSAYLLASCVLFFMIMWVIANGTGGWMRWMAAGVALLSFLAGYIWMARIVLGREDDRPIPALTRRQGDRGNGHTAVVYFTHGEPETYDPIGWINQFREFDYQKISFIPFLFRPFFLFALRQHYLIIGRSNHRRTHFQMLKSLERSFRDDGDITTRFYICFLDDNPRPDAAVIQALNDGASCIIVAEVFVSVSNHTAEGRDLINELDLNGIPVDIRFTGPMWDSEELYGMFIERVHEQLNGIDKSKVGIMLVGHGQPDEWDVEWPTETEHEIEFRRRILERFEEDGFPKENLSLAWMEFKEPKPALKVEEFVQRGIEKIFYFSAAISADSMHSQYDVPHLVSFARIPKDFPVINLGAWNDDPNVIQAIKEKVVSCLQVAFLVNETEQSFAEPSAD
jgi:protoheme ferro-lyase